MCIVKGVEKKHNFRREVLMVKLIVKHKKTGEERTVDITNIEFTNGEDVLPDVEGVRKDLFSAAKGLADWDDVPDEDVDVLFEDGESLIGKDERIVSCLLPLPDRIKIGEAIMNYLNAKPTVNELKEDWAQRVKDLRNEYFNAIKIIIELLKPTWEAVHNVGFRVGEAIIGWPNDDWFAESPEEIFNDIWNILEGAGGEYNATGVCLEKFKKG